MLIDIAISEPITLEYSIFGEGEPLIFLHGGGAGFHFYEPFLNEVGKYYKVYAFTYPGFDESTNMRNYDSESFMQLISTFAKKMKLTEFVLMGHSLGGGIATYFASHQTDFTIKKLVLLAPLGKEYKKGPLSLIYNLQIQYSREQEFDPHYFDLVTAYRQQKMKDVLRKKRSKVNLNYLINCARLYFFMSDTDFTKNYEKLSLPIYLFWGDKDLTLGTDTFESAWGNAVKPNVKTTIFKGYGHNFFFPKHNEILEVIGK